MPCTIAELLHANRDHLPVDRLFCRRRLRRPRGRQQTRHTSAPQDFSDARLCDLATACRSLARPQVLDEIEHLVHPREQLLKGGWVAVALQQAGGKRQAPVDLVTLLLRHFALSSGKGRKTRSRPGSQILVKPKANSPTVALGPLSRRTASGRLPVGTTYVETILNAKSPEQKTGSPPAHCVRTSSPLSVLSMSSLRQWASRSLFGGVDRVSEGRSAR